MTTAVATDLAVECRGVTKEFGSGDTRVQVLRGIDLDVPTGEITLLVGPSGCGKTTLISIICGLLKPTAGEVTLFGVPRSDLPDRKLVDFRGRNIGFVFQQYNLLPALTAAENAALPLIIAGHPRPARWNGPARCWKRWTWANGRTPCRRSCPAASSSGWPSPGRWCTSRGCWCATSRRRRWTRPAGGR